MGENAEMEYSIAEGDGADMFDVITDKDTQEGIITVKQVSSPCLHFIVERCTVDFCFSVKGRKKPRVYFSIFYMLSILPVSGDACDYTSSKLSAFIMDTKKVI